MAADTGRFPSGNTFPPGTTNIPAGVTIDGTGLTTTVPLLVKNGKNLSGVEVQVTGSAASGYLLRDAGGTLRGDLGLVVTANDWIGSSAANDVTLRAETGGVIIQAADVAKGVKIWSAGNTGTNEGFIQVITNTGVKLGYTAASSITILDTAATMVSPTCVLTGSTKVQFNGRISPVAGANTAAASTFTMPAGDSCVVTGTGTINYITTTNWDVGSRIYLQFAAAAVVAHNTGSVPGSTAAVLLSGGANITFAANTILVLYYNGANWIDLRKIA